MNPPLLDQQQLEEQYIATVYWFRRSEQLLAKRRTPETIRQYDLSRQRMNQMEAVLRREQFGY